MLRLPEMDELMRILSYIPASVDVARLALARHAQLLSNVSSLVSGTVGSAALGFAYWWIAARYFTLETVGLTAATISVTQITALVSECGLGTILIGETLSHGKKGFGLISAALIISSTGAALLGILFLGLSSLVSIELGRITNSYAGAFLFILGCWTTSFVSILNSAFAGLLRGPFQMYLALSISTIKLVMIIVVGVYYGSAAKEEAVFATWVTGLAVSGFVFAMLLVPLNGGRFPAPRFRAIRPLVSRAFSYHLLDLVIQVPTVLMPFVVTVMLSPAINAAFNAALMIIRVASNIPSALSTFIFAIGASDRQAFASRLRFSLVVLTSCSVVIALFLGSFSNFILTFLTRSTR